MSRKRKGKAEKERRDIIHRIREILKTGLEANLVGKILKGLVLKHLLLLAMKVL